VAALHKKSTGDEPGPLSEPKSGSDRRESQCKDVASEPKFSLGPVATAPGSDG
jgi:hypothetical protein